jgi:hypothetical protein
MFPLGLVGSGLLVTATAFAKTLPRFVVGVGILLVIVAVLVASGAVVLAGGGDGVHIALASALFGFAAVALSPLGTVVLKRAGLL